MLYYWVFCFMFFFNLCYYVFLGFNVVVVGCFFVIEMVLSLFWVENFLLFIIVMIMLVLVMLLIVLNVLLGEKVVFIVLMYELKFIVGILFYFDYFLC